MPRALVTPFTVLHDVLRSGRGADRIQMKRNAESHDVTQRQELARKVKECREAEGMKQVTLAALAGVTERTIQRLEAGLRVEERTIRQIAKVFGIEERTLSVPGSPTGRERNSMLKTYFEEMTRFDRWANERLLNWMEARPEDPELTQVYAHILGENLPWLHLLRAEVVPESVQSEPDWSLSECRDNFAPTMDALAVYLSGLSEEEFGAIVRSSSPNGNSFQNTVLEVLTNLLAHSEHHRGQMVAAIATKTGEYVPTVYMSYLRYRNQAK